MRILGIDPGSSRIGYGVIESGNELRMIDCGCLELGSGEQLLNVASSICKLVHKFKPDLVSIEMLYFSNNQKTGIRVAEARGVIKLMILQSNIPMLEYGPREVKQAVTNDGFASKTSVSRMVCRLLKLKSITGHDDVADALAIAITAAHRYKLDLLRDSNRG